MSSTSTEVPDNLVLWNLPQTLLGAGIKRSVWYQLVREGVAPRPVKVTAKRVAWVKAEVLAFRQSLIDKRLGHDRPASEQPEILQRRARGSR